MKIQYLIAPVHNSILVTDYLSKMGIKTVRQPPYSPDLAPCDFSLSPKLKEKLGDCRYETIEEIKEAVTKVIDTLTKEDFHGAFQKFLERYNKCITAGGDYFKGDLNFMFVLSIRVSIRKSLEAYCVLLIYIYIYIYIYIFDTNTLLYSIVSCIILILQKNLVSVYWGEIRAQIYFNNIFLSKDICLIFFKSLPVLTDFSPPFSFACDIF